MNFEDITFMKYLVSGFSKMILNFLLLLVVLGLITKGISVLGHKLKKSVLRRTLDHEARKQIETGFSMGVSVINIIVALLFLLILLDKLGINLKPILATAGVAGIAVGFAAKAIIEDILSGISLITSGQIRVGDYVEVAGKCGTVEKIDVKMITLRDIEGRVHFIRNRLVDIITNYTREYAFAVLDYGVSYNEDIDNVCNTLKEIFDNDLKPNPEYAGKILDEIEILGLDSLDESSVTIRVRIKTLPKENFEIKRIFNKLVKKKFDEKGIEFPYPSRTVFLKKND